MIIKISILIVAFMVGRLSKRVNLGNNRKYRNMLIHIGAIMLKYKGENDEAYSDLETIREAICYNKDVLLCRK